MCLFLYEFYFISLYICLYAITHSFDYSSFIVNDESSNCEKPNSVLCCFFTFYFTRFISSFSKLFCLFRVLCNSRCILRLVFLLPLPPNIVGIYKVQLNVQIALISFVTLSLSFVKHDWCFIFFLSLLPSNKFYIANYSFLLPFWLFPNALFFHVFFFQWNCFTVFLLRFTYKFTFLVYRNVTDFSVLILHPTRLLKIFISCNSFLFYLYGFLYKWSCHLRTEIILLLLNAYYFLFLLLL